MKKIIDIVLIYIAAIIMLAHNMTPHQHEDSHREVQFISEETNCCIVGWFRVVLNIDFGEEHLEKFSTSEIVFSQSDDQSNDHRDFMTVSWNAYSMLFQLKMDLPLFDFPTNTGNHLITPNLRGPPVAS